MCPMCAHPPQGDHLPMTESTVIAFRFATDHDDQVLRDLSELDSHRPLERPAVLAVVDGHPIAALSLATGEIVADPFTRTEDVVRMLRVRVAALAGARDPQRHRTGLSRLRLAA